jgi:HlyD family secretion protein
MSGSEMAKRDRIGSASAPMMLGFATLVLLVGGLGAWAGLTTLDGAIIASGRIEVAQNRQVVQHPDGGVVASIEVADGDAVQAGQILMRLDGTLLRPELAIVENQLFEVLARRGRLEAERDDRPAIAFPEALAEAADRPEVAEIRDGQVRLFAARRETEARQAEQLVRRIDQIESQIGGLDAQLAARRTQLELLARELEDQRALFAKGLSRADRLLALEREAARIEGDLGELTASRAQAGERITEIDLQQLGLAASRREEAIAELRDVATRELELAERRRVLAERVARLDIRAPVAGIVLGLQVTTPRAVLRPADPVLYLIPQDRPPVVAVQIAPLHVDQVRIGQEVRLHLPSLASGDTPDLQGRVAVLSADVMRDEATQAAFYRAEVELLPGEAARLADERLLPGMPVEAFFRTEARTPLSYLVQPFTDYLSRAFRES